MKLLRLALCILTAALFISACGNKETTSTNTPENSNANASSNANETAPTPLDELAAGKKYFETNCANCHKETGKGGPVEIEGEKLKPEDLTSASMIKEPDSEYIKYMREGIPDEGMPSFKDILTEEQMTHLVKYIRKELQKQ